MQHTPPPAEFADLLLAANPEAWPSRREEAHALFVALASGIAQGRIVLPPAWLTSELPKTFPPE